MNYPILRSALGLAALAIALVVPASADLTTVDFSPLSATGPIDLNYGSNPAGLTLNGVTFHYDDFGSGVDSASATAAGIRGTTYGVLEFFFDSPADRLLLDFSLPRATGVDAYGFVAGTGSGSLDYSGGAFDQAALYFSVEAPEFTVSNVSYEPIPEPASVLLFGTGMAGLILARARRRRERG